jgi:site-specific DNA-methyltransferase (adenine-specific)
MIETKLIHGDCLEKLKKLSDCSVDSVVTDPPYGLSFMGKKWDYDVPSVEVWKECLRVLKPGGHLLAFAGTRTQHRMAVRIEDAGFEIRDMIAWVYGSGFPKSHNLKDEWQGWGTALKPALEPITVARKPLIGTVADNVLEHGTGGLNIDGCRVATDDVLPKMSGKAILGGSSDGWDRPWKNDPNGLVRRQAAADAAIEKANTLGRWPANLIHDGSNEVVGLFPVTGASKATPRNNGEFKSVAKGRDLPHITYGHDDNGGSAARFFYCAKASKADRDEGCEALPKKENKFGNQRNGEDFGNGSVNDKFTTQPSRNHHPTVKPTALMRYLCRLVTPPEGIVLDPFMGSGSTGKAAVLEGFQFIGIEREESYMEIAEARINPAKTPA